MKWWHDHGVRKHDKTMNRVIVCAWEWKKVYIKKMICYKKVCKYSIMKVIQNEQLMDVIEWIESIEQSQSRRTVSLLWLHYLFLHCTCTKELHRSRVVSVIESAPSQQSGSPLLIAVVKKSIYFYIPFCDNENTKFEKENTNRPLFNAATHWLYPSHHKAPPQKK